LGGYPSPNLEVVAELGKSEELAPEEAMMRVARRRYGEALAPAVVKAWQACSAAFREYPFNASLVYDAPQQMGPANLLWGQPTGYRATMTGLPYDDLDRWRANYPAETFVGQFMKMADGFSGALQELRKAAAANKPLVPEQARALAGELSVMEACAIDFRSVANQGRFVIARQALAAAKDKDAARQACRTLEETLHSEIELARRLYAIQRQDSRIGFEATNHYFFIPQDLVEKVVNCHDLLTRWLPAERARLGL
jgi:hypothetical protein